ncbi:MAG: hypothetical protein WD738_21990 [Pirellulales bacterium]
MMKIHSVFARAGLVVALLVASSQVAQAGTILKLNLGGDPAPDVEYTGGVAGVLSTVDDGDGSAGSPGDQNTAVEFLDFLSLISDISSADASYSLNGVTAVGPASVLFGTVVAQDFAGGTFQLWDDSPVPVLLLDVALTTSALVGPIGPPATGAVFSTTFGTPLGGTLAPLIVPGTVSVSIAMTDVNGGAGLSVTPIGPGVGTLNEFVADVTKTIAAERIPEPTAGVLLLVGGLMAAPRMRRRA